MGAWSTDIFSNDTALDALAHIGAAAGLSGLDAPEDWTEATRSAVRARAKAIEDCAIGDLARERDLAGRTALVWLATLSAATGTRLPFPARETAIAVLRQDQVQARSRAAGRKTESPSGSLHALEAQSRDVLLETVERDVPDLRPDQHATALFLVQVSASTHSVGQHLADLFRAEPDCAGLDAELFDPFAKRLLDFNPEQRAAVTRALVAIASRKEQLTVRWTDESCTAFQVAACMLMGAGAPLGEVFRLLALEAGEQDDWARRSPDRAAVMASYRNMILSYEGKPVVMESETLAGAFERARREKRTGLINI